MEGPNFCEGSEVEINNIRYFGLTKYHKKDKGLDGSRYKESLSLHKCVVMNKGGYRNRCSY